MATGCLHRHQQGQAEQQGAPEGPAQIANIVSLSRSCGVLHRCHAPSTPPSCFGSRVPCGRSRHAAGRPDQLTSALFQAPVLQGAS